VYALRVVAPLDDLFPDDDVRERHERHVPADPKTAFGAALGIPIAPDALVRTLFRLRGLARGGSAHGALRAVGFEHLVCEDDCIVLGAAGRPWSPRGGIVPLARAGPGQVRMVVSVEASPAGEGALLATETRVAATDVRSRRASRRHWLVVGPVSALIRRRWLAAAERAAR
jgi:hypothetical protein